MARKSVIEEPEYHGRGDKNSESYTELLEAPRFSYQKRFHNKGHLNLVTEFLKGFTPGVFNSL